MWIEWLNNIKTGAISFWESIDVSKVVDLFVYDGQNPLIPDCFCFFSSDLSGYTGCWRGAILCVSTS